MAETHERSEDSAVVTFTDAARAKLIEILDQQNLRGAAAVRVAVRGRSGDSFDYQMGLEEDGQPSPGDTVLEAGDFKVFLDADTLPKIRGASVDFENQLMGGGFRIHNPNPAWDDPLAGEIQRLVDTAINPAVASHGGHVELIDVKDNNVYVRLGGGCQGCGMVDVTLRQGIEVIIKKEFPQIVGVIDTTDHAGGANPFYQPAKGGDSGASPFHQPSKG